MSLNWNNVKPACCAKWLVLPTVYSDALSYGEQLDKFCYQLNQLVENNNILPDFITEMIKEYISSGAIGEVVSDVLADYILNVKYPPNGITPAVGDGSADDTEAIQGCIDYASTYGGVVYFPYGTYMTRSLKMKTGVSLFGFDRYRTSLTLKGGANDGLLYGDVSDVGVINLTLNGNGANQSGNITCVNLNCYNALFSQLIIKNSYNLFNYTGKYGHLQMHDIIFGDCGANCFTVNGNVDAQCTRMIFNNLSEVSGRSVIEINTNKGEFNFKSLANCATCLVVNGNENKITCFIENAITEYNNNGMHNSIDVYGVNIIDYHRKSVYNEVGEDLTVDVHRSMFEKVAVNKETNIHGNESTHIDGSSTLNIGGIRKEIFASDKTKVVGGTYTQTVTGTNTEVSNGDKIVNVGGKYTQTVTGANTEVSHGDKIVNVNGNIHEVSANKTETTGNKTVSASGSITENAADIILNSTNPLTYKTPDKKANYDTVPFKDASRTYNVLVENENTENALNSLNRWGNIPKGRVLIIGDSFAGNWQGYDKGSWSQRFIKKLGNPTNNIFSFSGGGFIAGDNINHKNYQQNFDDYIKPEISGFVDEITLVIIQGGLNDYKQRYEDEISAVENLLNDVMSYIPNASVYGLTSLGLFKLYSDTMLGINRGFENCGVGNTTYGNGLMLGQEGLFADDKLHPNEKGHDYIANKLYSILVNNGDDNLASFGLFTANGGGGIITRTIDGFIYLIGSGVDSTPSETNSIVFPNKLPTYFCPEGYNSFIGYTDAGVAYFSINGSNGELSVMVPGLTSLPSGIGNWRFRLTNSYFDK